MSKGNKPITYITEAKLIAAMDTWVNKSELEGKFYLNARVVIPSAEHRVRFPVGSQINTGLLVNIEIGKGWFESENTIYVVIAKANEEAYRMTNPS